MLQVVHSELQITCYLLARSSLGQRTSSYDMYFRDLFQEEASLAYRHRLKLPLEAYPGTAILNLKKINEWETLK